MSLTSYRAAPPRDNILYRGEPGRGLLRFALRPCFAGAGCSTPRHCVPGSNGFRHDEEVLGPGAGAAGRPGGDLLSRVLRRSTIGAEGFHGRVRDGIGCGPLAIATRSSRRTGAVFVSIRGKAKVEGHAVTLATRAWARMTSARHKQRKASSRSSD